MRKRVAFLAPLFLALLSACSARTASLFPPAAGEPEVLIHVVAHGWHTGIAVRVSDVARGVWPEAFDFATESVEVGWGDRDFYMAREAGSGLALRAALWPSASVLHVQGFSGPVKGRFPESEIVEIRLSRPGFDRLCAFLHENYARNAGGAAKALGPGHEPGSRFYLGSAKYHVFRTCNVWTGQALRAAGCPLRPGVAFTRDGLMKRVRKLGRGVKS